MFKAVVPSSLAVCALALAGCSTPGKPAPTHSTKSLSTSASSTSKFAKRGPARLHRPPADVCPKPPPVPEAPAAASWDATKAPVAVKQTGDTWNLRAEGAPLGAVAAELARASGKPLLAVGAGANVPIWARIEGQKLETLVERLARATGTEAVKDGVGYLLVHPQRAVEMRRAEKAMRVQLSPIETRIIESEQPAQVAPLIAWAALGCRGELMSVPSRGWLIAKETRQRLSDMEVLLEWASTEEAAQIEGVEFDLDRRVTYGEADALAKTCQPAEQAKDAGGKPVGELILASTEGDVVVGCGGDRRVHAPAKVTLTRNSLRALGVQKLASNVYASPELLETKRKVGATQTLQLHVFQSSKPGELAKLVQAQFDDARTFIYHPRSALLVAADKELMPLVASFIDEYEEAK